MRYRVDAVSVTTVFAVLAAQVCGLVMNWLSYIVLVYLLVVRHVNLVEHNHAHVPIFYSAFLNELLGWMCFLSNGVPLEFSRIHHVRNHHRYNQRFGSSEQDWSSLYGFHRTHFPDKPIGLVYYVLTFPAITVCHCLLTIL